MVGYIPNGCHVQRRHPGLHSLCFVVACVVEEEVHLSCVRVGQGSCQLLQEFQELVLVDGVITLEEGHDAMTTTHARNYSLAWLVWSSVLHHYLLFDT